MENVLPLRSLEVKGYRAIRHLTLPVLERVNLFVGPNNAGKTSLLEAVRLYSGPSREKALVEILRERSGYHPVSLRRMKDAPKSSEVELALDTARSLFYGAYSGPTASVWLGPPEGSTDGLEITLPWFADWSHDSGGEAEPNIVVEPSTPLLRLVGDQRVEDLTLDDFLRGYQLRLRGTRSRTQFIPAQGLQDPVLPTLWGQVAEMGYVPKVEDALRVIVPDLERIYLIERGSTHRLFIQLRGVRRPVPITNMGEGTSRVLGIALALVASEEGLLLIDEVESGLHHGVQSEVWRSIFTLADILDVQVFATTHSWDAVVGFQAAANQSRAAGILYRLEREPDGEIYAERYTEEEVAVAADQQVEVR